MAIGLIALIAVGLLLLLGIVWFVRRSRGPSKPLMPCPDCGRKVSQKARMCPGCGRPHPGGKSLWPYLLLALVVGGLIAGVFFFGLANQRKRVEPPKVFKGKSGSPKFDSKSSKKIYKKKAEKKEEKKEEKEEKYEFKGKK